MTHDSYRKIAEASTDWISENLQNFNLRAANSLNLIEQLKPIAELVFASEIVLLNSNADVELERKSKEWSHHCWSQIREGEILREAMESRTDFLLFAAMYAPFRRYDLINERLEQTLRQRLETSGASEQFPAWVVILMIRTLNTLGIQPPWKLEDCFRRTWLFGLPEVAVIQGMRGYELTHTVFFLTDFGRRFQDLPGIHREYLILHLPQWMQSCRTANHYDMLAELVMVARCIRMDDQEDWGAVLLSRASSGEQDFREQYHPMLTALMASVMSLNDPSTAVLPGIALDPTS